MLLGNKDGQRNETTGKVVRTEMRARKASLKVLFSERELQKDVNP